MQTDSKVQICRHNQWQIYVQTIEIYIEMQSEVAIPTESKVQICRQHQRKVYDIQQKVDIDIHSEVDIDIESKAYIHMWINSKVNIQKDSKVHPNIEPRVCVLI